MLDGCVWFANFLFVHRVAIWEFFSAMCMNVSYQIQFCSYFVPAMDDSFVFWVYEPVPISSMFYRMLIRTNMLEKMLIFKDSKFLRYMQQFAIAYAEISSLISRTRLWTNFCLPFQNESGKLVLLWWNTLCATFILLQLICTRLSYSWTREGLVCLTWLGFRIQRWHHPNLMVSAQVLRTFCVVCRVN